MSKNKVFKLHTHNFVSIKVEVNLGKQPTGPWWKALFDFFYNIAYYVGFAVIRTFSFFLNLFVNICYLFFWPFNKLSRIIFHRLKKDIYLTGISFKTRMQLLVSPSFSSTLGIFIILCLISVALLGGFGFAANALKAKTNVLLQATLGKYYLEQAKDNLKTDNFEKANLNFTQAYESFSKTQQELNSLGGVLNKILNLVPQKKDADRLAQAGALISQSGNDMVNFYNVSKELQFTPLGLSAKRPIPQIFDDLDIYMSGAQNKISKADTLINQINQKSLQGINPQDFADLKNSLDAMNLAVQNLGQFFDITKNVIGMNPNVLLLFANNNELRPVGGFFGSFGSFHLKDGAIKDLHISSIYDLDGQLGEKIVPPTPELAINNRWFLRDSNWFANFPDTAKKVTNFYEKEGGETPQVIVVVTPTFVADLLKITGPINIPGSKTVLDSENFVEQMQALTSVEARDPKHPKQVLADFFPLFLSKLSSMSREQTKNMLEVLQRNLNLKQMVFYSTSDEVEQAFEKFNWTGKIFSTDRDYLEVVSANLAGTKTDLSIKQDISLYSTVNENGDIYNKITITRTNTGPNMDGLQNTSFLRVYVPQGSQLISAAGFDQKDLNFTAPDDYKLDPDVYAWEKASVKDVVTGTTIGKEADKTFFGNWITVAGGQSRTVELAYKLPFKLNNLDHYSLMAQKQIGSMNEVLNYKVNFQGRKVIWKTFDSQITGNSFNVSQPFEQDRFFGVILSR